MEAFYKAISSRLELKSAEFGKNIEPQHKQIIGKSYKCMSDCYNKPGTIEESSDCAEKCHSSVQAVHQELQQVVENIQGFFQNCLQGCRIEHNKAPEEELKACITKCTDQAVSKFDDARITAERIISKYSKK
jgi:hypothetical protein